MTLENIQRIGLLQNEINRMYSEYCNRVNPLMTEKNALYDNINKLFCTHPQWVMFIQRHGLNDFEPYNEKLNFKFDFENNTCYINILRMWRDEIDYDENTRSFKISELVDFLNNHHYYDALIERAKRIEKAHEENCKKEQETEEYQKYLELKAKYESNV